MVFMKKSVFLDVMAHFHLDHQIWADKQIQVNNNELSLNDTHYSITQIQGPSTPWET